MNKIIKTYYVIRDVDKYKKGDIVKLPRDEAASFVNNEFMTPFHLAFKRGIVNDINNIYEYEDKDIKDNKKKEKKVNKWQ